MRHVLVAAIDRIGEEALHRVLQKQREEPGGLHAIRQLDLSGLHGGQEGVLILRLELDEGLAVSLFQERIDGRQSGAVALCRICFALVALCRQSRLERALRVEPARCPEGTRKLPVDVDRAAGFLAADAEVVVGNEPVDDGLDQSRFLRREELPAAGNDLRRRIGSHGLPWQGARDRPREARGRSGDRKHGDGGEEETPVHPDRIAMAHIRCLENTGACLGKLRPS